MRNGFWFGLAMALWLALWMAGLGGALAQTPAIGVPAAGAPQERAAPATQAAPSATPLPVPVPASAPSAPPPPPVLDVEPALHTLEQQVEAAEKRIAAVKDHDDELGRLRGEVEGMMYESTQLAEALRPRLAEVKSQIDKLGPPPKAEGPPEAAPVVAERARLGALTTALDGAIKTTELTWVRARQMIERITDLRHALFAQSIFQRLPSPLAPALWHDAWDDFHSVWNTVYYVGSTWVEQALPKSASVMAVFVVAGVLYLVLHQTFRGFTISRMRRHPTPVPFFERAAAITWFAPLRAIAPVFAVLLLYVGLDALDVLHFWADRVLWTLVKTVLIFSSIAAVVASVLAPGEPCWRLVPLDATSSRGLNRILQALAWVFAVDLALAEVSRTLTLNVPFNVIETVVANLATAGLTTCALLARFVPFDVYKDGATEPTEHERQSISRLAPMWLKGPFWLVVAGIVAATLAGYIALGRFMAHQMVLTGVVVVVTGMLYLAIRVVTREPKQAGLQVGAMLESQFGLDESRRQTLGRLTELALTVLLVMLAVPFILLQWGFSGADIGDWFKSMVFGFEVGKFRISLVRIVLGILLFVGLILVSRRLQHWLREVVLTPAHLDSGLADSIDTVLGYAGTIVSGLIAISYAGFDVTNLAIVAGALSVGIGFGLQSVVNNFVSGLILLFERPIKVGDWIVVGADEGHVRKISVRATEIETFDRSSVIVPNADLITGRVKNWTLRDAVGRQRITVAVRYEYDPAKARELLLELAREHKSVLDYPAPSVTFDAFGPDAATLSLNIYIGDVNRLAGAKSELSFSILHAFPAAGIPLAQPPSAGVASTSVADEIRISVPIAYDTDFEAARRVILDCAAASGGLARTPAPVVEFEAFGPAAVTLAVVAAVRDRTSAGQVRTELALAIAAALRRAGIGGPAAMHSVRLTDLEPLRQGLTQALEQRRQREAGGG